jgi:hypothetical protein
MPPSSDKTELKPNMRFEARWLRTPARDPKLQDAPRATPDSRWGVGWVVGVRAGTYLVQPEGQPIGAPVELRPRDASHIELEVRESPEDEWLPYDNPRSPLPPSDSKRSG